MNFIINRCVSLRELLFHGLNRTFVGGRTALEFIINALQEMNTTFIRGVTDWLHLVLNCNYPIEFQPKMSIMFVVGKQVPLNEIEVLIYETFQPNILR